MIGDRVSPNGEIARVRVLSIFITREFPPRPGARSGPGRVIRGRGGGVSGWCNHGAATYNWLRWIWLRSDRRKDAAEQVWRLDIRRSAISRVDASSIKTRRSRVVPSNTLFRITYTFAFFSGRDVSRHFSYSTSHSIRREWVSQIHATTHTTASDIIDYRVYRFPSMTAYSGRYN